MAEKSHPETGLATQYLVIKAHIMPLTIDSTLGLLLSTIFHPIWCWFTALVIVHALPVSAAYLVPVCVLITLGYTLFHANYKYKTRGVWLKIDPKSDKVVITGGSRGLGMAIVRALCTAYPSLPIMILDVVEPLVSNECSNVSFRRTDLSKLDSLLGVLQELDAGFGDATIVINNAGIRHDEPFVDLSDEQVMKIYNVNTFAPMRIIKHYVGKATKPDSIKHPNRLYVATVSSILGTLGPANLSVYSATKASLIQLHESISHELSPQFRDSVRFLVMTPGQLNTAMFLDISPPNGFLAPIVDSSEIATLLVTAIEHGERGNLCVPLYSNFLPGVKCLPFAVQEACRWFSAMDEKVKPA
ncbi:hypothetical protein BABINDRAFT_161875 [Babjeviella inositovora NRRL Y-12698]|uniref:NAD(P)-binding protein n=1 Tax=Babjeviella inositovora NRRL Y-12698 TaxID=984486 RepID=A0A1E3QP45_9ASCO|nr:uncharacterized protein BABINDRAFT_161875 [Babjeviella inositovora NRRL Y-12698]ODQ79479.1 hypothetical protein BABINDRAFT_161875 [Babjeviella inositovora NRRL Y-12698]